jgi:hypothetical protein
MSNKRHKMSHTAAEEEEEEAEAETKDVVRSALMRLPMDILCEIMSMGDFFEMFRLWPIVCKATNALLSSCRVSHKEIEFDFKLDVPAAAFKAMRPVASLVRTVALRPRCDTSAVLNGMQSWTNVRRLGLHGCVMDAATRTSLCASAPRLRALDLSKGSRVTAELLSQLVPCMPFLEELNLRDCSFIEDKALEHVSKLRGLRWLDIGNCGEITNRGLLHLAALSQLQELCINSCSSIGDAGLAHLANLPLTALDIGDCPEITHAGLVHLSKMPLVSLHLWGCLLDNPLPGTAHGLSYLSDLKLQKLDLAYMGGDTFNDALVHLQAMPIQRLRLDGTAVLSDAGLAHLAKLPLKTLSLLGCKNITTLVPLAGMPLVSLNLSLCRELRDEELQHLASLHQLASLHLDDNDWLSHVGLTYLTALVPHLRLLTLWNCEFFPGAALRNPEEQRRCAMPLKVLAAGHCRVARSFSCPM